MTDRKKLLAHPITTACMQEAFFCPPWKDACPVRQETLGRSIYSFGRQRVPPFWHLIRMKWLCKEWATGPADLSDCSAWPLRCVRHSHSLAKLIRLLETVVRCVDLVTHSQNSHWKGFSSSWLGAPMLKMWKCAPMLKNHSFDMGPPLWQSLIHFTTNEWWINSFYLMWMLWMMWQIFNLMSVSANS